MRDGPTRGDRSKRRAGRLLVASYLGVLAISHLVQWHRGDPAPVAEPNQNIVQVLAVAGAERRPPAVRLAWSEWGPDSPAETEPILLLHGSPGSHRDFRTLAPALGEHRRVLAIDLPGFGGSSLRVPDYSFTAHGRYALDLLDHLGIEEAHVLGFSMGGGVALSLYEQAPRRVDSLVLLSAVGVQELELLGDYHINRLLHALQLGVIWTAHNGLPHFGHLDRFPLNPPYARNFFDSDQRPLRQVLERLEPPALIVHGERDFLVSATAAREHHRLLPQSELVLLDSHHFFLFRDGARVAPLIEGFLERVEDGEAPRRSQAPAERRRSAAAPFDPATLPPFSGMSLALMVVLLALATLVSEDLTCIGAGLLAAQGRLGFVPAAAACFAGIFVGDVLLFLAGRFFGRAALQVPPLRWWISQEAVKLSSEWFRRRGLAVIALSRFTPGARLPFYFAAGALRTGFWRFAGYFAFAAAVWTPALVALAMWVGTQALVHLAWIQRRASFLLLLVIALVVVQRLLLVPLLTWSGRRRLVGRWRRWTRWELWPPWLFYPPLALYVVWLGLRHRSPTLFTAANPGIPAGGFVGESKAEILRGLSAGGDLVARWDLLPAGAPLEERLAAVDRFCGRHGLGFPLVLKPDAGQRGSGVAVVATREEAADYLRRSTVDTLVQEHVPGRELGVFYARRPDEERGRIFSITEKSLPTVEGDGRRSVEQLILADPRAVAMADLYLRRQGANRWRVPEAGEVLLLTDLGTHCRGAVFLDGRDHRTPQLEELVDRLSRGFDGFYFGRYDLRGPSLEALRRGGPLKVIELNGVTSEATHIYDPKLGLFDAYRTLSRQWRLAFEIGAENRRRGCEPSTVRELLRLLLAYRRRARCHPETESTPVARRAR